MEIRKKAIFVEIHMYMEMKYRLGCIMLSLIFVFILSATGASKAQKSYRDYPEWEMLPRAVDFEDEGYQKAYQRLVDEGEAGYDGLLAIVRECEDTQLAIRALSILRASNGDKRIVIAGLKEVLAERLPTATGGEGWLMTSIAEALAVMGDESDMEAVVPMLYHPDLRVRAIGVRCIGERGGRQFIEILEQARSRDSISLVRDEIGKAIAAIESRLAVQNAGE